MKNVYKLANFVFLRAFVFVAMIVMGTGIARADYVLDKELTWDQVKGGTTPFVLVSGGNVLYGDGGSAQDCAYGPISNISEKVHSVYWKVENGSTYSNGAVLFRSYTMAGEPYNFWGRDGYHYLNSNPGGDVIFILGKLNGNNVGGQDMNNGAVWTVTTTSGGYHIKNVGNNTYLNGKNTSATADKVWKFYSIKESGRQDFVFSGYDTNDGYTLRPIRQKGKNLVYVDDENTTVTLHGVMDTPNWYFNNDRWPLDWSNPYNNDADVRNCLAYFEKTLSAYTNHKAGSYCDVFRLHLDPKWTNDRNIQATNGGDENDISQFSPDRLRTYMDKLYWPIIEKALAKGLYVIMRPPGVCPQNIQVGGEYQEYLKTVWGIVASDERVQKYAGNIMIELANEPIAVLDKDGTNANNRPSVLHDFFQPIVDVIREKGFKGIVLSSGSGYQSQYGGYKTNPITGDNIGYAVHWYPGWMGTDRSFDDETIRKQFESQVPVVNSRPIVVTEIDWSPTDTGNPKKDKNGNIQYNEMGQVMYENYNTWGTGRTDQFGKVFKYTHDYYKNISMTLTHPYEYVDFDQLFNNNRVTYAFQDKPEPKQACAYTCFVEWYPKLYTNHWIEGKEPVEDDSEGNDLTSSMFHEWTGVGADATIKSTPTSEYNLGASVNAVYGYSNVSHTHYADLSEYATLSVTVTEGTPRFFINQKIANGTAPDNMIQIPSNAEQTAKYQTVVDNGDGSKTFNIDLQAIVADQGYAHLNSIKAEYYNSTVTVTSMKLLEIDNCLKVTTTEAKANVWDWQVRYPLPTALEAGKNYTIEIVAKAANATNIGVWPVVSSDESKLQYGEIDVTTEWTTKSFDTNGTNAYDYLFFNIGKVGGDFMVSNIKIIDKSTGTVVLNNKMNDNSTWTKTQNELTVETVSSDTEAEGIPSVPSDDDLAPEPTYGDATPELASGQRRPVNNKNPMWLMHVDVWNQADPQKIIDLIPEDIKPYVVMNLSLSCAYNTTLGVYERPQDAIKTYKSWGSVCQQNGMWFTCQPASGGHTHIMDDDLETYEYFFKQYPNFLGWNFAEQFWGFNVPGDKSSTTEETRIALFAKLIPMHHQYGGFLTISFCGSENSHALNPVGMLKRNADLLKASEDYPESILWLYKYTHPVAFYNNESVTFGPFVAGLTKNYGVRYDNCGYNDALNYLYGENSGIKYPTAAGIGTVMEQMAQNGGAVWDGPELIWTEDFQNLATSNVNGYTQRNWGTFPGFRNIWIDMFRKVIDGTIYIPTQKEVQAKTKIAIVNDVTSGTIEDKYGTWGDLYDNLYKVNDPLNTSRDNGNGQMQNNLSYQKSTGRYGTIPMMPEFYSAEAKAIPSQVKKSQRWATLDAKKAAFDAAYPEVSTGDLFVSRYKNQLVTYNPYSNLGKTATNKRSASGHVPLRFNTCQSMDLTWANYSSAIVKEYSDKVYFYLNNYRTDTIAAVVDKIVINGASSKPSYTMTKRQQAEASATETWSNNVYTLEVSHMGPVDLTINCAGNATEGRWTNAVSDAALSTPAQPKKFVGTIIKEAEDMNYKSIQACIDNYIDQDRSIRGHAGNGIMKMGTNTNGGLTTNVKTNSTESYNVTVRYSNTDKAGNINLSVGGTTKQLALEKTAVNEWKKATVAFDFTEGDNTFKLDNNNGIGIWVDQVEFTPASIAAEEYDIVLGTPENGSVTADKTKATEGTIVTLTVTPKTGYALDGWAMGKTKVSISQNANGTYSFTMPDNVVTLTPIFKDVTVVYQLDFASTVNSSLPEGWRTIDGTEVREYGNQYSGGPRIFSTFTGTYTHALYWRCFGSTAAADYGKLADYPLTLKVGTYKLSYRVAAWNGTPMYKAQILNADGSVLKSSDDITATPNASGVLTANLSDTEEKSFEFTVSEQGKYVINFVAQNGGEFMLLDCRINAISDGAGLVEPEPEPEPELAVQSDLTKDMFKTWSDATADATVNGSADCAYNLGISTGCVYGKSDVSNIDYADLSRYETLAVTVSEGSPRLFFNQSANDLLLTPSDTKYVTSVENADGSITYNVNLKQITADKGFAHLNSIKASAFNTEVTVTRIQLINKEDIKLFDFEDFIASGNATFNRKEHSLTGGDGGWSYANGVDLSAYKYLVITSGQNRNMCKTSVKLFLTFDDETIHGETSGNNQFTEKGSGLWLDQWNHNNIIVINLPKLQSAGYDITKLKELKFNFWGDASDVFYINNVYATNTLPNYSEGDHVREISTVGNYSTVCLPYDAAYSGCVVYEIAGKDDKDLYLNRIDGLMEAGKSYFFKSTENYEGNSAHKAIFYKAGSFEARQPLASNGLVGTFKDGDNVPDNGKSYIVSKNELYVVNQGTTVAFKANRAYINIEAVPAKSDAAGVRMRINGFDDETAIAAAEMTDAQVVAIYSASGVKQNSLQKGLNIVRMSDNSVKKIIVR